MVELPRFNGFITNNGIAITHSNTAIHKPILGYVSASIRPKELMFAMLFLRQPKQLD